MAINFSTPIINIVSFILFILITALTFSKDNLSNNNKLYIYGLLFIFFLISIYSLFSIEQFVTQSFEYLIKAYFFLITAIFIFFSYSKKENFTYIRFILIYSFLITLLNVFNMIDYQGTSTNYLVYSLLLGISIIILWFDILFKNISKHKKIFFMFLSLYFLSMNLMAGSRGTFIFTLIILFIIFFIKIRTIKWYKFFI